MVKLNLVTRLNAPLVGIHLFCRVYPNQPYEKSLEFIPIGILTTIVRELFLHHNGPHTLSQNSRKQEVFFLSLLSPL